MASTIHGWRLYTIIRDPDTNLLVLRGQRGLLVTDRVSPIAECPGFYPYAEHVTQEQLEAHYDGTLDIPPHTEGPQEGCTCGFYFRRLYPAVMSEAAQPQYIAAHCTAIGKSILHEEGARVRQHQIDFLCPPQPGARLLLLKKPDDINPDDFSIYPLYSTYSTYFGGYDLSAYEERDAREVLQEIGDRLGVPVLNPKSIHACLDCIQANGWEIEDLPPEEER